MNQRPSRDWLKWLKRDVRFKIRKHLREEERELGVRLGRNA